MLNYLILIRFQMDGPCDLLCIFKMTRIKLQEAMGSLYDFASEQLPPSVIGHVNKDPMVAALLPE